MKYHFLLLTVLLLSSFTSNSQTVVDEVRLYFDQEKVQSRQVGMDVSQSSRYIAFAFDNGVIKVFDTRANRQIYSQLYDYTDLFEIRFSSNENHIIVVTKSKIMVVDWKLDGTIVFNTNLENEPTRVDVAFKKQLVVIGTRGLQIIFYDLGKLEQIKKVTLKEGHLIAGLDFNEEEKKLLVYTRTKTNFGAKVKIMDVETFQIINESPKKIDKERPYCANFINRTNSVMIYTMTGKIITWSTSTNEVQELTKIKLSEFKNFVVPSSMTEFNGDYIYSGYFLGFAVFDRSLQQVFTTRKSNRSEAKGGGRSFAWQMGVDVNNVKLLGGTSKLLINAFGDNINHIYDAEKRRIIGYFYTDANNEFVVVARDGRVDGTPETFSKLAWTARKSNKRLPLDVNLSQNITPRLYADLVYGKSQNRELTVVDAIAFAPTLSINAPDSISTSTNSTVTISYVTSSNGDPVKNVTVTVNGKTLNEGTRGFKRLDESVTVSLVGGRNVIKLSAISEKGYESAPDQIIVNYNGAPAKSELYLLIVGLNQYKNPKYNLNYANADASAFKTSIADGSQTIFQSVKEYLIKDIDATKSNIESKFNEIASIIGPEDVFIFYYAGHGVMSEEEQPMFYVAPYDVTQMYGNNEILHEKAISADQLKAFSSTISAQKQLFVLDACQSGGMTEMLAMRGAAEEKAIAQLARSTGTYWLTASGSQQFATEFAELGHGLFTYTLLEGLSGKADGGSMDKKITVKELSAYLNDRVPELSEQHKGQAQYPTSYGFGQDFPVVIVK